MTARAFLCVVAMSLCAASASLTASEQDGAVHVKSRHSVEDTVERARRMLESQGLRVFGVIDHQQEAVSIGQQMLPTQLLVFGNPEVGTRIMQSNRVAALDLPMKLLVWEVANGTVWVSYQRAGRLAERYGFSPEDELFEQVGEMLKDLAKAAAS